jgi:hypothetical protein
VGQFPAQLLLGSKYQSRHVVPLQAQLLRDFVIAQFAVIAHDPRHAIVIEEEVGELPVICRIIHTEAVFGASPDGWPLSCSEKLMLAVFTPIRLLARSSDIRCSGRWSSMAIAVAIAQEIAGRTGVVTGKGLAARA